MKTIRPLIISIIRKNSIIKKTNSQKEHTTKQTKNKKTIKHIRFRFFSEKSNRCNEDNY